MKKYFFITLCSLFILSAKGQLLGKETWTKITHEVTQLVIIDENVQSELERLIFSTSQDTLEHYKYFQLYVKGDANTKILEFWRSNYPYKSKNLVGFFILRGYLVFVYNELPDFLKLSKHKKKFSYTEHKLGDLLMMEDDTGCWVIEYTKPLFKLLDYPAK